MLMRWSKKRIIVLVLVLLAASLAVGMITSTYFFGTMGFPGSEKFEGLMAPKPKVMKTVTAVTTKPGVESLAGRAEAGEAPLPQQVEYVNRMIIRTASIDMESEDPEKVVNEVMLIADSLGGYVESMGVHRDERISANIVVRVPEKSFFDALATVSYTHLTLPTN